MKQLEYLNLALNNVTRIENLTGVLCDVQDTLYTHVNDDCDSQLAPE